MKNIDTVMPADPLTVNELKEAFFPLKINKTSACDGINFNVVKHCETSLKSGVFQNNFKIHKFNSLFKNGDPKNVSNYRRTYVYPCFFKILEHIMYNCLYQYLNYEKILFAKQSGFQAWLSTEHAIVKLNDQIHESFENRSLHTRCFYKYI